MAWATWPLRGSYFCMLHNRKWIPIQYVHYMLRSQLMYNSAVSLLADRFWYNKLTDISCTRCCLFSIALSPSYSVGDFWQTSPPSIWRGGNDLHPPRSSDAIKHDEVRWGEPFNTRNLLLLPKYFIDLTYKIKHRQLTNIWVIYLCGVLMTGIKFNDMKRTIIYLHDKIWVSSKPIAPNKILNKNWFPLPFAVVRVLGCGPGFHLWLVKKTSTPYLWVSQLGLGRRVDYC